jgi:haloacetate dehalogenase
VIGGSGPPLLLLHGYPQTHVMWRKVAARLAQDFTVVVPNLRGYGDSAKPSGGEKLVNYSKRALALDQVEVMAALGHSRFAVAGHDRGARETHRLLRDHPDKVTRGVTLDIVPTLLLFETIGQKEATSSWHFFFLIQGHGLPEHMIGSDPEFFLRHMFAALLYYLDAIEPAAWAEYLRCFRVAAMRPRGQTAPGFERGRTGFGKKVSIRRNEESDADLLPTRSREVHDYIRNTIVFCSVISRIVDGMPPMP